MSGQYFIDLSRKYGSDIISIRVCSGLMVVLNSHDQIKDAFIRRTDLTDRNEISVFNLIDRKDEGETRKRGMIERARSVVAYAGAARRRAYLATVLVRPPSGHRSGRRQACHAYILQLGLHLTQA